MLMMTKDRQKGKAIREVIVEARSDRTDTQLAAMIVASIIARHEWRPDRAGLRAALGNETAMCR